MQEKKARKSSTAGLLCLFLGSIGAHDFYLGRTARALIRVVLFAILLGLIFYVVKLKSDLLLSALSMTLAEVTSAANTIKTLDTASSILSIGIGIWNIVDLVIIVRGGHEYIRKLGFEPIIDNKAAQAPTAAPNNTPITPANMATPQQGETFGQPNMTTGQFPTNTDGTTLPNNQ